MTQEQIVEWERVFQEGRSLEQAKDFGGAAAAYERARRIDDSHADLAFCLGQCLEALGNVEEAQRMFIEARDRDVLRFRADSPIQSVIRRTAQAHAAEGVRLLDLETSLSSPDVFVDHVHMDFRGNLLAACAALGMIRQMLPQAGLKEPTRSEDDLLDLCRQRLRYDGHEQYRLAMVVYQRKTVPPFAGQIDHNVELTSLYEELIRLRRAEQAGKESEATYLEALRPWPQDTYLILRHGAFLVEAGRLREAIDIYRRALAARPFDMQIREALARLLAQSALREEAVKVLTSKDAPDRYCRKDALLLLGAHCAASGNIPEAAAIYDELGRMEPENVDVLVNRAAAALHRNDLTGMKQCLDKALVLDPGSVEALTNMGNYYAKQQRPREGAEWFAKAVQADPHSPLARMGLALQLVRLGRMDEALEHAARAVMLEPDFLEAHLLLAGLHDRAGRKEEATKEMELYTLFKPSQR